MAQPFPVDTNPFTLRFRDAPTELSFSQSWHERWRKFDALWTVLSFLHNCVFVWRARLLPHELPLYVVMSLPCMRAVSLAALRSCRRYGDYRPAVMALLRSIRLCCHVSTYWLALPSCAFYHVALVDIVLGELIVSFAFCTLFIEHVMLQVPMVAARVMLLTMRGGLCDHIDAVLSSGAAPRAAASAGLGLPIGNASSLLAFPPPAATAGSTASAIAAAVTAAAAADPMCSHLDRALAAACHACSFLVAWLVPSALPRSPCKAQATFWGVLTGTVVPSTFVYLLECDARRLFLRSGGRQLRWSAPVFVDAVTAAVAVYCLVATLWVLLATVY